MSMNSEVNFIFYITYVKNSAIYVSVIRNYIDLPSLDSIIKDIEKSRLEWNVRNTVLNIYLKEK